MIGFTDQPIDTAAALAEIERRARGAGAVVSFSGLVRSDGGRVTMLRLDHHPALTQASLDAIAAAAQARFDLTALTIIHRVGAVAPGDPIVFAAAAAKHRRAAFDAVDYAMDRLKTEAVLWKKEARPDGDRWVEPTLADHDHAAGWRKR